MAIARYGWADGDGTNGTSHTFAFDVGSGSDRYLLAFAWIGTDITGLAATFNGTSMTLLGTKLLAAETAYVAAFGLANPSSGSHNLIVTRTPTSAHILVSAIAYTGVSSTVEAVVTGDTTSSGINTLTATIVNAGCWLSAGFGGHYAGQPPFQDTPAGGDGTFIDDNGYIGLVGQLGIYDSDGTVGTGSQSIAGYRGFGPDSSSGVAVALAPAGGGGGGGGKPALYYAQMRHQ